MTITISPLSPVFTKRGLTDYEIDAVTRYLLGQSDKIASNKLGILERTYKARRIAGTQKITRGRPSETLKTCFKDGLHITIDRRDFDEASAFTKKQKALLSYIFEGKTYDQIAYDENRSHSAIKQRIKNLHLFTTRWQPVLNNAATSLYNDMHSPSPSFNHLRSVVTLSA